MEKLELQKIANEVRKDIVTAVHAAKAGHPGGSLSAADLFTYLYFQEMNIDPKDPKKADRDRFVLSKGHTAPGLYSALAERGYFPKEDLKTLRHLGSYLQGHPDMKHIPGVDMTSGSLLVGAVSGNLLPDFLVSALSVAIYGMFLAVIIPPAKKNRAILGVVIGAMAVSTIFAVVPVLNKVSAGFVIIITTVLVAGIAAYFCPVPEEKEA